MYKSTRNSFYRVANDDELHSSASQPLVASILLRYKIHLFCSWKKSKRTFANFLIISRESSRIMQKHLNQRIRIEQIPFVSKLFYWRGKIVYSTLSSVLMTKQSAVEWQETRGQVSEGAAVRRLRHWQINKR